MTTPQIKVWLQNYLDERVKLQNANPDRTIAMMQVLALVEISEELTAMRLLMQNGRPW